MNILAFIVLLALYKAGDASQSDYLSNADQKATWSNGQVKHHSESTDLLFDRYERLAKLGDGVQATIVKAYDREEGSYVAIKCFLAPKPQDQSRFDEYARREWKIYQLLNGKCESCVQAYDFKQGETGWCIVMELFDSDLLDHVDYLVRQNYYMTIKDVSMITRGVAQCIQLLQELGLAHNDIKLENIFIKYVEGTHQIARVALGDFGAVNKIGNYEEIMTPKYTPYERLPQWYTEANSDSWSLGICVINMYSGKFLLEQNSSWEFALEEQDNLFWKLQPTYYEQLKLSLGMNVMTQQKPQDVSAYAENLSKLISRPVQKKTELDQYVIVDYLARVIRKDHQIRLSIEDTLKHPIVLLG